MKNTQQKPSEFQMEIEKYEKNTEISDLCCQSLKIVERANRGKIENWN